MFRWAVEKWTQGQFLAALFLSNRAARKVHSQHASALFDPSPLKFEIQELSEGQERDEELLFNVPLNALQRARTQRDDKIEAAMLIYDFFRRDLHTEKRHAYERLKTVKEELNDAFEQLNDAHGDAGSNARYVAGWHQRSKSNVPLWGKAGRSIPQRKFFGMSHGKRERAESARDDAWRDVCDARDEIARLKSAKAEIGAEIGFLKRAIAEVQKLKRAGKTEASLKAQVTADLQSRDLLDREIETMEAARSNFRQESHWSAQIEARKLDIVELKRRRKAFLSQFDLPEREAERRAHFMDQRSFRT